MARTCLIGFMVSAALCISTSGQTLPLLHGRGAEWLSWTPMQRTAYVQGLADGYMGGFLKACELADELFEVGKAHRLGDKHHLSEIPSARCLAHRGEFSEAKLDDKGQFEVGIAVIRAEMPKAMDIKKLKPAPTRARNRTS